MAWAFRSKSDNVNSSYAEATIVITKPSGTASGDLLFAAIASDDFNISSAPSGWTLIRNTLSSYANRLLTYYKVAGGSEPADYTWTFSASTDLTGAVLAYTGLTSTPLDVENVQENASSTSVTAPSITVTNNDSLLIFVGSTNEDNDATTYTPPSGMTERVDRFNTWTSMEVADQNVASGATGTRVATATNAHPNLGYLVAFIQTVAAGSKGGLALLGVGS